MSARPRVTRQARPDWWTPAEIAAHSKVSTRTVLRWIESGELRAVTLPGAGRGIRAMRRVSDAEYQAFEAARQP